MTVPAPELRLPTPGIAAGQRVPAEALSHLLKSAGWVKMFGIFNLVMTALAGLGAIGLMMMPAGPSRSEGAWALAVLVAFGAPSGVLLLSNARRVRALHAGGPGDPLADVFHTTRQLWLLLAIFYAASLILQILQIVRLLG